MSKKDYRYYKHLVVVPHEDMKKYRASEDHNFLKLEAMLANPPKIDMSRSKAFLDREPMVNRAYEKYTQKAKEKERQKKLREQQARRQLQKDNFELNF